MKHFDVKNILTVNVNWLGDVIFSTPVFQTLKDHHPQAKITALAMSRVRAVFDLIPVVDQVILLDDPQFRGLLGFWRLVSRLRREGFDMAVHIHGSRSRSLISTLAGIPIRIGYQRSGRDIFLTHKTVVDTKTLHRRDCYLSLVESIGLDVFDRKTRLSVPAQLGDDLKLKLKEVGLSLNDRYIVLHTAANWDLKRWPQENWARLIEHIKEATGQRIILTGSEADRAWIEGIIKMTQSVPVLVLIGKTNLNELAHLLDGAQCLISADSGPLHLASSLGVNAVGIFGPTRPELTGPCGIGRVKILQHDVGCNREPCYDLSCSDNVCMKAVTVSEVHKAVLSLLQ